MKKIISLLLAALMMLSFAACSNQKASPAPAASAPETAIPAQESAATENAGVEWPVKDVQVCVPYKAGGGVDKVARMVCAELETNTGRSFVVTNKPEGNGIIAINELMAQDPDGYNLMIVSNRDLFGHIVNKIEGVEYGKDSFTYIATLLEGADALLAQGGKFANFDEMIAYARENPGKVTIATSNNTGLKTLEIICDKLGVEMSGVAYGSGADAFADLLGGHVDGAMVALSFYAQGKENGIVPVLTMSTEKFPVDDLDVPCVADIGVPEAASPMLRFLLGPAGMDQALVDAIVAQLDAIYADGADLPAKIMAQYDSPNYKTGDALAAFVEENFQFRLDQASAD